MLTENLGGNIAADNNPEQHQDGTLAVDDDEDYEVPDLIEEIIGNCMNSLHCDCDFIRRVEGLHSQSVHC